MIRLASYAAATQRLQALVVALSTAVLVSACSLPTAPSETPSATTDQPGPLQAPVRPEIADALARLDAVGRPVRAEIVVGSLPDGVHAYADRVITVSQRWLDEHIISPEVLAGVLSHENWHLLNGPHHCGDGRRDRHATPGAWQYHAETLRLLGAYTAADVVATSPMNYCE